MYYQYIRSKKPDKPFLKWLYPVFDASYLYCSFVHSILSSGIFPELLRP
jgi:hypothetical protein